MKFNYGDPSVSDKSCDALHDRSNGLHMGYHVARDHDVSWAMLPLDFLCYTKIEEIAASWRSRRDRFVDNVLRRIYPENFPSNFLESSEECPSLLATSTRNLFASPESP